MLVGEALFGYLMIRWCSSMLVCVCTWMWRQGILYFWFLFISSSKNSDRANDLLLWSSMIQVCLNCFLWLIIWVYFHLHYFCAAFSKSSIFTNLSTLWHNRLLSLLMLYLPRHAISILEKPYCLTIGSVLHLAHEVQSGDGCLDTCHSSHSVFFGHVFYSTTTFVTKSIFLEECPFC